MRKIVTLCFIIFTLVFSSMGFVGIAFAVEASSFSINANTASVQTGGLFTVTVGAQGLSKMDGFEVRLEAEMDKLELVTAVTCIQGGFTVPAKVTGNDIMMAFAKMGSAPSENGNVTLSTLTFKTKVPGELKVTLKSVKLLTQALVESSYTLGSTVSVTVSDRAPDTGGGNSGNNGNNGGHGNDNGTLVVHANIDADGNASATLSSSAIQAASDNASGGVVKIQVQAAVGVKTVSAAIPAQNIKSSGNDLKAVEIQLGNVTVSVSIDLLKSHIGEASSFVQLTVMKVDESALPKAVRSIVGNNPVYDFTLNLDGNKISSFNGKDVKVSFGYTLEAGKNAGKVVVYYVNDNGRLEIVKNGKYDAASGKVLFSPDHFSKYAAVYNEVKFKDIANLAWAKESIESLAAREVINGFGDKSFKPGSNVTRAEFVKMLMQAFDLADSGATSLLKDVKAGAWYYSSIATAEKLGIVKGKTDGSFGVNDPISRQEITVMVYRAAQLLKADLSGEGTAKPFKDGSAIAAYASEAVAAVAKAAIVNGMPDGSFAPKSQATRGEAAVMIYRLFNLVY